MHLSRPKLLTKNKNVIIENVKQAKIYISQNKLSTEELNNLIQIDPSPTKRYVGWMAKQWVNKTITDIDDLRNTVEEFNTFAEKGKIKSPDISKYKSFNDLKKEVDDLNQSGAGRSSKDLESDYETVIDDNNLLIMVPHTHEASRKLGLSYFSFRDCGDGTKDSAWCTTYKAPDHFLDYYYNNNITFYYVKVRSNDLIEKIKEEFPKRWKLLIVVALAVFPDGQIDFYDAADKQLSQSEIKKYLNIIGIS